MDYLYIYALLADSTYPGVCNGLFSNSIAAYYFQKNIEPSSTTIPWTQMSMFNANSSSE
jgi:hypothetical protein